MGTMNFPATCTAVVTSVQTATVTETMTYAPEPTEIDADYEECLTDEEAENMADVFRQLIQSYSDELAMNALTEDFVDYASVVNSLMNRSLVDYGRARERAVQLAHRGSLLRVQL